MNTTSSEPGTTRDGRVAALGAAARRVLGYLERSDGTTRRDLGSDLGLPTPTVVSAVAKLMAAGLIEEYTPPAHPGRTGRPAGGVRLASTRPVLGFLGWDSGSLTVSVLSYVGDVIAAADFDIGMRPDGVAALEPALAYLAMIGTVDWAGDQERPAHQARPGEATADARSDRLTAVVVGAPAPFQTGVGIPASRFVPVEVTQPTGPVLPFVPWLRTDPAPELAGRLNVPVIVENNANLAALGEHTAGGVDGDLIYVRFAERGVGGGLVLGGYWSAAPVGSVANSGTSMSTTTGRCVRAGAGAASTRCSGRPWSTPFSRCMPRP